MKEILMLFINPVSFSVIVIVCFFLFLTKKSWNSVVKKAVVRFTSKWLKIDTEQQKKLVGKKVISTSIVKQLYKNIDESHSKIEELRTHNQSLFKYWQFYMFSFLDKFLVLNSKTSLLWLFNNPGSTKELFQLNMVVSNLVKNIDLEKESIFNALLVHSLINKDDKDLYTVSNIGRDFLKFIGFVTN